MKLGEVRFIPRPPSSATRVTSKPSPTISPLLRTPGKSPGGSCWAASRTCPSSESARERNANSAPGAVPYFPKATARIRHPAQQVVAQLRWLGHLAWAGAFLGTPSTERRVTPLAPAFDLAHDACPVPADVPVPDHAREMKDDPSDVVPGEACTHGGRSRPRDCG